MNEYTIKLTEYELNVIATALASIAWKDANPVIVSLQKQVEALRDKPTEVVDNAA